MNEKVKKAEMPETRREWRKKKKKQIRTRLLPIWLRLILVTVLLAVSLVLGAMFGYGVVGDGDPLDVLEKETWQHIYDVVYQNVDSSSPASIERRPQ